MAHAQNAQQVKPPEMEELAILSRLRARLTKEESALPNVRNVPITPEFHLMEKLASDAHQVKLLQFQVSAPCADLDLEQLMELHVFNLESLAVIDKEESATLNAKLAHHTPEYLKTVSHVAVVDQTPR